MRTFVLLLIAGFASVAFAAPAPHYRFQRLAPSSGVGHSHALQINNDGTVIGSAEVNGKMHPVLWKDGEVIDLGVLPGNDSGLGTAINNAGQYIADAPGSYFRADLVTPPAGYTTPQGSALNDAGTVLGSMHHISSGGSLAFFYRNGTLTSLPPLIPDGYSHGIAINSMGQMLVAAQKTQSDAVPVIYDGTAIIADLSNALTAASFRISSQGYAMNDRGHVVGIGEVTITSTGGEPYERVHGFIYKDGAVTDIQPLRGYDYSLAWSINNHDDVVGACTTFEELSTPCLWRGKRIYRIANRIIGGTDGSTLISAVDINDNGMIIGTLRKGADRQSFLLTPIGHKRSKK